MAAHAMPSASGRLAAAAYMGTYATPCRSSARIRHAMPLICARRMRQPTPCHAARQRTPPAGTRATPCRLSARAGHAGMQDVRQVLQRGGAVAHRLSRRGGDRRGGESPTERLCVPRPRVRRAKPAGC
eukprot:364805-Chlamydomonas_euryale.AAC.5